LHDIEGNKKARPELDKMLNAVRKGDLVVITSIDRLGRDYQLIKEMWELITKDLQADIKVLDMPLLDTTANADTLDSRFISDLTLQILGYVAQKERESIKNGILSTGLTKSTLPKGLTIKGVWRLVPLMPLSWKCRRDSTPKV
jgi:DNA invertase Pin-like site-specific DNA recombinase